MKYGVLAIVISACGGQKLDGTIIGASFTLSSSASQAGNNAVSFVLSSVDDICSALGGTGGVPDSQNLSISLRNTSASGDAMQITPGAYAVEGATGLLASVYYLKYGDNCSDADALAADSGTITLATIDLTTGQLSGALDLGFGDDHLSGSFTADSCARFNNVGCIPPPN